MPTDLHILPNLRQMTSDKQTSSIRRALQVYPMVLYGFPTQQENH